MDRIFGGNHAKTIREIRFAAILLPEFNAKSDLTVINNESLTHFIFFSSFFKTLIVIIQEIPYKMNSLIIFDSAILC